MSFIKNDETSRVYAPGYFLAHEECVRETHEMTQANAETTSEGGKYIPMGTVYPSNDGNAIGIVYEDVDVTNGNMPGSVVTQGVVYENRLNVSETAKAALQSLGFKFVQDSTVTRPNWNK